MDNQFQPTLIKPPYFHIIGWIMCAITVGGLLLVFVVFRDIQPDDSLSMWIGSILRVVSLTFMLWLLFGILSLATQTQTLARKISAILLISPFVVLIGYFVYILILFFFFPTADIFHLGGGSSGFN